MRKMLFVTVLLALAGCDDRQSVPKAAVVVSVGDVWRYCSGNPWSNNACAEYTVVDKRNGWVKYTYAGGGEDASTETWFVVGAEKIAGEKP